MIISVTMLNTAQLVENSSMSNDRPRPPEQGTRHPDSQHADHQIDGQERASVFSRKDGKIPK